MRPTSIGSSKTRVCFLFPDMSPAGEEKGALCFATLYRLATLSLVLVFAAQAQGSTLLSYWPMNDGLSNSTATVCQNLGTLGSAYNATFGVAYSAGTSVVDAPRNCLGHNESGNLIGKPYGAGGYSSTYTASGGNSYTLPQWTTFGALRLWPDFQRHNTAPISTQSNNWGMNFVYVPGGSTTNAGQGGGGISGLGRQPAPTATLPSACGCNGTARKRRPRTPPAAAAHSPPTPPPPASTVRLMTDNF